MRSSTGFRTLLAKALAVRGAPARRLPEVPFYGTLTTAAFSQRIAIQLNCVIMIRRSLDFLTHTRTNFLGKCAECSAVLIVVADHQCILPKISSPHLIKDTAVFILRVRVVNLTPARLIPQRFAAGIQNCQKKGHVRSDRAWSAR